MLDPNWTPEAGYSHAADLMRILAEHDARTELADEGSPEPSDLEPT
jgi:hypothetical protein